jgi:alkanesulfonate monooxygenase SsuD/methylene tetrahydromethanopterin reductase-like flavin-dependent oxidoreductase (luciferase family)
MRFGIFVMGTRGGTYADVLGQIERADELGFDNVVLAERHFRHADLLYPSTLGMGAAIAARTSRIRIGTAARILSLDHPIHVAEDAATVDVLSGGRLDFGVTRASLDEEAHAVFDSPVEQSEGRFLEALEVILRAWAGEGFPFEGEHFRIPELSVFPRPVQKPHPPIYVVAVSPERLAFAAAGGWSAYVGAIRSVDELADTAARFWAAREDAGHRRDGAQLSVNRFIYVSESDDRAREEIERPFMEFMHERAPDLRAALSAKYGEDALDFDTFVRDFLVAGGPDTVTARLAELLERVDTGYLLATLNFITVDHALCSRSMELFASEVMPALQARRQQRGASGVATVAR